MYKFFLILKYYSMNKLPREIVNEIISNLNSCKDVLNFCITNSGNKELCKNDSIYLIKTIIQKKFPSFQVNDFIKEISLDFDKINNESSKKFSYLNGTGVYQMEFDKMPDVGIFSSHSNFYYYTWKQVHDTLLHISKAIKDAKIDNIRKNIIISDFTKVFASYAESARTNVYLPNNEIETLNVLYTLTIRNLGIDDAKLEKDLNEIDFDKFIDTFIIFNKHLWIDKYEKFEDIKFIQPVYFEKGMDKKKYILTILCKILNLKDSGLAPYIINLNLNADSKDRYNSDVDSDDESVDSYLREDFDDDTDSVDSYLREDFEDDTDSIISSYLED